jgi:hypothetical protein
MNAQVDPEKFEKLCDDVCDIKTALRGNEEFRQKGLIDGLEDVRLEVREIKSWRSSLDLRVAALTGAITATLFVAKLLLTGKF